MKTAVIIAGGPSLTRADVALVEESGTYMIGINCAYQISGQLNILYACDAAFWNEHYTKINGVVKISLEKTKYKDVFHLENDGTHGVSDCFPKVKTGGNSGYQAINLAYLLGFKKIILLGYDMKITAGRVHWHGNHEKLNNPNDNVIKNWISNYKDLAALLAARNIQVINASRDTALDCFIQVELTNLI